MYSGLNEITRHSYQFLISLEFSGQIFENSQMSDFMKISLVGAELFQADKQKDGQLLRIQ
jgi:hypothetical protein